MDDLIKRLQHFENHQSTAGDQYGAEVLHHAWQSITRLQAIVEAAQAFCDEITYEEEVGDGTNVIICGLCGTADGHLDDCAAKVTMDALAALKME